MAKREYMAYLLRIWRDTSNGPWRATLDNPTSGERTGFAHLRELVAYLEAQTGEKLQAPPSKEEHNI